MPGLTSKRQVLFDFVRFLIEFTMPVEFRGQHLIREIYLQVVGLLELWNQSKLISHSNNRAIR